MSNSRKALKIMKHLGQNLDVFDEEVPAFMDFPINNKDYRPHAHSPQCHKVRHASPAYLTEMQVKLKDIFKVDMRCCPGRGFPNATMRQKGLYADAILLSEIMTECSTWEQQGQLGIQSMLERLEAHTFQTETAQAALNAEEIIVKTGAKAQQWAASEESVQYLITLFKIPRNLKHSRHLLKNLKINGTEETMLKASMPVAAKLYESSNPPAFNPDKLALWHASEKDLLRSFSPRLIDALRRYKVTDSGYVLPEDIMLRVIRRGFLSVPDSYPKECLPIASVLLSDGNVRLDDLFKVAQEV